ncbi:hypothetical protein Adt_15730 [Abeliophyllum distichum]|uniref:TPX2 C-terminal domain-containing protein n=1 Tax=Abeliophyllum distichum TaxID=126358 RepID=A0ABD1U4B1_9LAMI
MMRRKNSKIIYSTFVSYGAIAKSLGESGVGTPFLRNKMGESVKSGATLEVSVSFGRFESDSLSWEKWSSFSPNKYLEEVENISTPGSVAQKKAYFEAHYKKIAARKAEQLEEENPMDPISQSPDEPISEDHIENSTSIDTELGVCNGEKSAEVVDNVTTVDEARDDYAGSMEEIDPESYTTDLTRITTSDVAKEDAAVAVEGGNSGVQEDKEELNDNAVNTKLNDREENVLVKEVTPQKYSQDGVEQPPEMKGGAENTSVIKKENPKSNARNQAQKVTPTKKGRNLAGTKKNIVSSAAKTPQVFAPRLSKPTSISMPISASRPLKKKVHETPLPKSRNTPVGESKRATPTSLHMSLSLGPANSSASFATTRKSFIMEKMGDKDIVKRAFKTFQNHINELRSPSDAKFSTSKQVSSTASEQKVSSSFTPRKENEGLRKAAENTVTQRAQLGTRSKSDSSGLHKGSGLNRKNATAVSHSIGLRRDERAEKRKEFLKHLEAKSIAREADGAQLRAKTKEEKEAEMGKLRQNLNFKATPIPSFSRGQGKGHSRKEGADNKIHPRPTSNSGRVEHTPRTSFSTSSKIG